MNISQRITQARQKAGLSPQELAQAIQVSEDDVLRWESGLASPTPCSWPPCAASFR